VPDSANDFAEYAYMYTPAARRVREQLPKDLLPKLISVIDDLARNPDSYPMRLYPLGKGSHGGELSLYTHREFPLEIMYEIDRENRRIYLMHFAVPIVELKRVFVSYSHADADWLDRLRKFLRPLEEQDLIRIWDDTKIQVGSDWTNEIEKSLKSAKMAVFLVTQDFLNSEFIKAHEISPLLERAKQQGVEIVWIAVKPSTVQESVLARFQAANDPKQPLATLPDPQQDQVLTEIYQKIKAAVA